MGSQSALGSIETHISFVFFTPDRVYKLLKPIALDFLDYSQPEDRIAAAQREFELNKRFAPDVYLGTADVYEDDELADRLIVMRRLPAERCLSRLLAESDASDCLRDVARIMATFHASAPTPADASMATRDAVMSNWEGNLHDMAPFVGSVLKEADYERAKRLIHRYLHHRQPLFDHRIASGFVREGHGDLTADDIYCLDDGPRIIDCLAFNDNWRVSDVLADIGFLTMDVHRLRSAAAAQGLVDWYQEFSNEQHPASLAHHYIAYRAHVRAKVACLRFSQGDEASADLARRYHDLALHHLEQGRIRLIMVGGGPGVGKSTVARGLCEHLGYTVLVNDEIRKDITATPRNEHRFAEPGGGIYDQATTDRTYDEMLREARVLLDRGEGLVLDASWSQEAHRQRARELARKHGAELVELECILPPAVAKERISRRLSTGFDSSDATPGTVDYIAANRDPWPSATTIPTIAAADKVIDQLVAQLRTTGFDP